MRLEKCWFCSSTIYPGHGIQFVRNDAKYVSVRSDFLGEFEENVSLLRSKIQEHIFRFCRSKCHKNFKMKRNPRKVKWTKAYRRLHGKDMTQDSTFELERKRNRPERYDRNMAEQTLKAIPLITKIRHHRLQKHITDRFVLPLQFVVCWTMKRFSSLINATPIFDRHKPGKKKELERDNKELEQDINMLPKKVISKVETLKMKVQVIPPQTQENLMEE
ncbi:hypothetical protein HU200_010954 [Digitaria exilis]|uniref:Large ribosomal subunit protein eL24-related N-terminal domain-containing protein n=1 Tax=Digitaria exilis TaxID=1010633 RepID=A0A835KLU7_9POAL|nr:hypothetical protein HU200_010954 [Digitaria exilis]